MIPHAGAGSWWVDYLRSVRVWVNAEGELCVRDRAGAVRAVASAGSAQGCWWVADQAQAAVGLADSPGGWLVISTGAGPVLALRTVDWLPPDLAVDSADSLRAAGAEAVATALGVRLEAVADALHAGSVGGQVTPEACLVLDRLPDRRWALAAAGVPMVMVLLYPLLLLLLPAALATGLAIAVLVLSPVYDLVPLHARYARTRDLPGLAHLWWSGDLAGQGIGLVQGDAAEQLVIADGYGWELWLAGPAGGGAGSIVLATRDNGAVHSLQVHDRDQRLLETVDAVGWVSAEAPLTVLASALAPMGLAVSSAVLPERGVTAGRRRARQAVVGPDAMTALGAMVMSGFLTAYFALIAGLYLLVAEALCFLGVGVALFALRFALTARMVT